MTRDEIMTILLHRENMLLLDDVTAENGTAVGHYHVRGNEFSPGAFSRKSHCPRCDSLRNSCPVRMRADVRRNGSRKAAGIHRAEQCEIPFPRKAGRYRRSPLPYP